MAAHSEPAWLTYVRDTISAEVERGEHEEEMSENAHLDLVCNMPRQAGLSGSLQLYTGRYTERGNDE